MSDKTPIEVKIQVACDKYCKQDDHLGLTGRIFKPSDFKAGVKWAIEELQRNEEVDFDEIESNYRKYRQELDGYESTSAYTFFLKNNKLSPFYKDNQE